MDSKLLALVLGSFFGFWSFYLYQKGINVGSTKPHPLSWAIWLMTVMVACYGAWIGKGGYGAWYYTAYCAMIFIILVKTIIKLGLSKADKWDVVLFFSTLPAIPIALLVSEEAGIIIVTIADLVGYHFTFKKAWKEPWSEPLKPWVIGIPSLIFITLAMGEYGFLTVFYSAATLVAFVVLILICVYRRSQVEISNT